MGTLEPTAENILSFMNDEEWMKHTLAWPSETGEINIDYRSVHTYTMSQDIAYIEPKARVY